MLGVSAVTFYLVTRWARPDVAQPTFPRGAQESLTLVGRTLLNKLIPRRILDDASCVY